jgi:hypothetical protein
MLIGGAIAASGWGLEVMSKLFHDGKPRRMRVDSWDKAMMNRDETIAAGKASA